MKNLEFDFFKSSKITSLNSVRGGEETGAGSATAYNGMEYCWDSDEIQDGEYVCVEDKRWC